MAASTERLALVPARGGSKGLPRKNVLPLGAIPLIGRVVGAAHAAKMISRVVVSTEDDEIASAALAQGADVPFRRPERLASDSAAMLDVVRHALQRLQDAEQYRPDVLVLLQANSPFTCAGDIDRVVSTLLETGADVVYTVAEIDHPPFWAQRIDEAGVPSFFVDEAHIPGFDRRQDMPAIFRPTGAISAMRTDYFWGCPDGEPRFHMPKRGQKTRTVIQDRVTSLDIDSPLDYLLAQAVVNHGRPKS